MQKKTVLISGGSGMIGNALKDLLEEEGYHVNILSRNGTPGSGALKWDIEKFTIEEEAISRADYVVNLAGAGIAEKRWSATRKKTLYESRIKSTQLLSKAMTEIKHNVKAFIGASAVGYYGDQGSQWLSEDMNPGNDYLARLCSDWEEATEKIATLNIRTVILRIGIVLSRTGGALEKMTQTLPFGFISYLGRGDQYYSWIHINDLCRMFLFAIKDQELKGRYNAAAPNPVTNKSLMQELLKRSEKCGVLTPAPGFGVRLLLGELASVVLGSQRCSTNKMISKGFQFQYPTVEEALEEIFP